MLALLLFILLIFNYSQSSSQRMGKIIQNYALQEIIGEGMYGKVYKAIHLKSKDEFAVKVIPVVKFQQNPKLQECTVNQINILSTIQQSPYIIRYIEMLKTPNNFYFVYEYCNGKTLESMLKQQGKFSETKALKIFKQLIQAFKVLNKYNIMHRDLKPDNIFFHNNNLKLGDFGFCKTLSKANDMASTMLGSPIYMAPEVLKGQIYTSKADIWSLGVVLYEMLFGFCPFQSNSIAKLISVLAETQLKLPLQVNNISQGTQNLLKKILVKDQFKRIDWLQLLQYSINQQGQISERRTPNSKLEDFNLINSQREINKFINESISTSDYSNLFKKTQHTPNNHTNTFYSSSNSKMPNNSNSNNNSTTHSANNSSNHSSNHSNQTSNNAIYGGNNSSFNKKIVKATSAKTTHQEIKQNQINQYDYNQNSQNLNITPKKNIGFQQSANFNIAEKYNGAQFKKHSQSTEPLANKRKKLLQDHNLCLSGVRTAISFLKSDENVGLIYSYILFEKVEQKLKKIINQINFSDLELQDMNFTISNQIKQIQRQLSQLKDELNNQTSFEISELKDSKAYLRTKFREKNEPNIKLWYDMVNFINDNKTSLQSKDLTPLQLTIAINNCLA